MSTSTQRINDEIRVREVRLIDEAGKQLGIVPTREAVLMARDKGLDLVEVAPNAQPPVCRIMDFGKYAFEQAKRDRDSRKNQKTIEIKTLRLRPKTSDYHEGFKVKQARQWLADGAKVKVMILFKGRELYVSADSARQQLLDVVNALSDVAVVEQRPDIEGRTMFMMLVPIGSKPPAKPAPAGQPAAKPAQPAAKPAQPAPAAQPPANRSQEQGKTEHA